MYVSPLPCFLQHHTVLSLSVTSYIKSVLEQKAGAHLKTRTRTRTHTHTHTHTHTLPLSLVLMNTGLVSTSWALALIDALTWQSCQWKWQIHFAGFIQRLPTKNKYSMLCHHRVTTHRLPPDWLLASRPAPARGGHCTRPIIGYTPRQTWQPVTYLCVGLSIQRVLLATCLSRIQYASLSDRWGSPLWKEIIFYWTHGSWHGYKYGAMIEFVLWVCIGMSMERAKKEEKKIKIQIGFITQTSLVWLFCSLQSTGCFY